MSLSNKTPLQYAEETLDLIQRGENSILLPGHPGIGKTQTLAILAQVFQEEGNNFLFVTTGNLATQQFLQFLDTDLQKNLPNFNNLIEQEDLEILPSATITYRSLSQFIQTGENPLERYSHIILDQYEYAGDETLREVIKSAHQNSSKIIVGASSNTQLSTHNTAELYKPFQLDQPTILDLIQSPDTHLNVCAIPHSWKNTSGKITQKSALPEEIHHKIMESIQHFDGQIILIQGSEKQYTGFQRFLHDNHPDLPLIYIGSHSSLEGIETKITQTQLENPDQSILLYTLFAGAESITYPYQIDTIVKLYASTAPAKTVNFLGRALHHSPEINWIEVVHQQAKSISHLNTTSTTPEDSINIIKAHLSTPSNHLNVTERSTTNTDTSIHNIGIQEGISLATSIQFFNAENGKFESQTGHLLNKGYTTINGEYYTSLDIKLSDIIELIEDNQNFLKLIERNPNSPIKSTEELELFFTTELNLSLQNINLSDITSLLGFVLIDSKQNHFGYTQKSSENFRLYKFKQTLQVILLKIKNYLTSQAERENGHLLQFIDGTYTENQLTEGISFKHYDEFQNPTFYKVILIGTNSTRTLYRIQIAKGIDPNNLELGQELLLSRTRNFATRTNTIRIPLETTTPNFPNGMSIDLTLNS